MMKSIELLKMLTNDMQETAKEAERVRAELEAFFEMCPDILVIAKNGKFTKVNAATSNTLGFSKQELINKDYAHFIHPDDIEQTATEANLISLGLPCDNFRNRYRCKDGTYRWLEWHGVSAGDVIYACARDITAQKDMADRFEMAFVTAPIGMAMVSKDGAWLKINSVLCEIVGYSEEELLKTTFQAITHPDDLDADLKEMSRVLAGEIIGYTMMKRYVRKDGSFVTVSLHVVGIQNAINQPQYFISHIVLN
jgi:PAS domain S-box-containing protein